MADDLRTRGENLMKDLVKEVKDKMDTVSKVKQMVKIAKELGEDTVEIDNVIEAAEGFSKMVIDRFDKTAPKE